MDRAEAVMDKTEKKVEKSKGRSKTVQERAKNWDELNKKLLAQKAKEEALALEKENWVDEEDDMEDVETGDAADAKTMTTEAAAQMVPLPEPEEEEL